MLDVKITPKGTNIPGHYRECEDPKCNRLIPCPHVRCQDHREDYAVTDWIVPHVESQQEKVIEEKYQNDK